MMKYLAFLPVFLLTFYSYAQFPVSPNARTENGLRTGQWTIFYDSAFKAVTSADSLVYYRLARFENDLPVGKVRDFYRSGQKQWDGYILSLDPEVYDGEFHQYHENGKLKVVGNYKNKELNGTYKEYSAKGVLVGDGQYLNNQATGRWLYYYESGKPLAEITWLHGKENGPKIFYYESGAVSAKGNMTDDKREGTWEKYYEGGKLKNRSMYANGNFNGPSEDFYESGATKEKGECKDGYYTGYWTSYFENGKKESEGNYSAPNGRTGHWKKYYESGKLESEFDMIKDKKNGTYFTYHPSGKIATQGFATDDHFSGFWTYLDTLGNAIAKGEYYNTDSMTGKWVYYYPNKNVKTEGNYIKNRKDGLWIFRYETGELDTEERDDHGVLHGDRIAYFKNGRIADKRTYDHGELHGLYESFYENGQAKAHGEFDHEKKIGDWINYYADGKIDEKNSYIAGKLNGTFLSYFNDGKLFDEGVYSNGKKIGEWKKYYENGQVSTRQIYSNGTYTSVSYFSNGLKKIESQGIGTGPDNKEEGLRKQYYENGKLKSEGKRINGLSEGKYVFYDSITGKKESEGFYDHGKFDKVWKFYTAKGKLETTQYYIRGFRESPKNVGDSISTLIRYSEFDQATAQLTWLNKVLKRDAEKNDPRWLIPLNLQADIYFGLRQYDKALSAFETFAAETKRMQGDTTDNYLTALNGIANCYSNTQRYNESLAINDRLISLWSAKGKESSTIIYNKAINLKDLGRKEEAKQILTDEWQRSVKLHGDSSVVTLKALNYLAGYLYDRNEYEASLEAYKELYKYSKKGGVYYLSTLQTASAVLRGLKRYKDAIDIMELALAYEVEHKLDIYPDYFADLVSLSESYYYNGNYGKARSVVTDALSALQKKGKGNSFDAARLIYREAYVMANADGEYAKSIRVLENAKDILEKESRQASGLYADVIDQLAVTHYNNPLTYSQAEKYYKQALSISDKKFGARSGSHYSDMLSLGNYYTQGFKLTRGDSIYQVVGKDIYANVDPASHLLPRYENYVGTLNLFRYQYTESIIHFQKAVDFYKPDQEKQFGSYAAALMDISYAYSISGDKSKGEGLIREALAVYEKHDDARSATYLNARRRLAEVMEDQFLFKEAETVYLSVVKGFGDNFGENVAAYRGTLFKLGQVQTRMNEFKKAEETLKKAIALSLKNSGATPEESYYLMLEAMGGLQVSQRNLVAAENYFRQARAAAQPYRDKVFYYIFLQRYGRFAADNGRHTQAEELFEEALQAVVNLVGDQHWFYAYIATDLTKTYLQLGKNAEAEKTILKAMTIAENNKVDEESSYISTMRSLVQSLRAMGRYDEAGKLQSTVMSYVEKKEGKGVRYAVEQLDLAAIMLDEKRYDDAIALLTSSRSIFEEELAADHENILISNNQLALALLARNRADEAKKYFEYNIEKRLANGKSNTTAHSVALHNMGYTLMRQGNFAEAEKNYNAAIALRTKLKVEYNLENQAAVLDDMAILYQGWGKDELAEKYWKETLQKMLTHIRTNFSFLSDYEKAKFWERTKSDFEYFNTFAVHRAVKNPLILGDMYNYRLVTKGILLSASNKLRKRIYASHDSTLILQYHQWTELREQLAKEYTAATSDQKTPHIDSLERSINGLEKELSISTEDSKADREQLITWKEVQRSLSSDEAAIEFVRYHYFDKTLSDSVVYAALVITTETKTNPKLVVMGNGDFLDTRAYRYYRNSIVSQSEDEQSYQNFWAKIEPLVNGKKRLYLSLDGVFNQVNLKTLRYPDGSYLMDDKDVVIVSNTRDVVAMKARKKLRLMETASLIGNPKFFTAGQSKTTINGNRAVDEEDRSGIAELPGTKVEIEAVQNMLDAKGWTINSLVQSDATEQHMKHLPSSRVVHLATHGFFQDDKNAVWSAQDPMLRSGILLTGAANFMQSKQETDGENGILTAYEASNLSLEGTEMVVLSACETARGEIQQGEGVYGLQRAFITAGAESLVMSLWKVDDEATQKLMSLFYENWMKGMEKSEALNQAQRTLKTLYPHPYYWGAFVMMRG